MSLALFGILQLEKGDPAGYGNLAGLIQVWLQDAGGFAMVGLVVYLLYALATPTDKSQSEKLRVPVSFWMIVAACISLICYAAYFVLLIRGKGAPPELLAPPPGQPVIIPPSTFQPQLRPIILMIAGAIALFGISEPFLRDMFKIFRRNLTIGFSGIRRIGNAFVDYTAELFTPRRIKALIGGMVVYGLLGLVINLLGFQRLFSIWTGWLYVALAVFICAMLILLLFEAEGPIWAIAKLSFKEAVRSQLLWVFLLLLVPFAFRNVLMSKVKPVDEIRALVGMGSFALTILLLFVATLVASLAIPNDIKNLNIYTIVSKPVERFEIVLGRFFGYISLFSLVLIAATGVSLVLVKNTSISAKAMDETYKARVPIRGKLEFRSRKDNFEGTNVGREFDYRKYIAGHELSPQRAVWNFSELPTSLKNIEGDVVPIEFTFDIFKLTKGEQNKGVLTNFRLVTYNCPQKAPLSQDNGEWQWKDQKRQEEYKKAVESLDQKQINIHNAKPGTPAWAEVNRLAEEFGIYEVRGKEVFDFTVTGIEVPAGIFRNAMQGTPPKETVSDKTTGAMVERAVPRLSIYVKCESGGQLLGMAEPDLYILEAEQPFELNFVKGMVGLWCRLCIILALAVACSTYLSGILSFLAAGFIFILGCFSEHINDLAFNRNVGGGPIRSIMQLVKAEQPTTPLSDTAGVKVVLGGDQVFAWFVRRFQNMIPDVDSLSWSTYVAEGFNVNTEYLVINVLVTLGYILPWAILAYYLMKSREVAA